jgi:hypothetical protein
VTHRPEQLVRDLFDFAAQGASGWPSVAALLPPPATNPDPRPPRAGCRASWRSTWRGGT